MLNRLTRRTRVALALALGSGAAVAFAAPCAMYRLTVNGHTVNTSAQRINGQIYVPINDVARALGQRVVMSGSQISIRPMLATRPGGISAGGTQQVANRLQGNIGQTLQSTRYQFTVLSMTRGANYEPQYTNEYNRGGGETVGDGQEFVVLKCRIKNITHERMSLAFPTYPRTNTALTDFDEQSFPAYRHDVFASGSAPLISEPLPGAAVSFNLIFKVPVNTRVKDLIYTAGIYSREETQVDFRVHLNQGG